MSTAFKKHKEFLKSNDKGKSSTLFFYLPSTTDRKESINQYKDNVQLHPFDCDYEEFNQFSSKKVPFQPHQPHLFNHFQTAREIVVNFMKHIVKISNAHLVRNANCLVINGSVGNDVKIVRMEVESDKYKLPY